MKPIQKSLIYNAYKENGLKFLDDLSTYLREPILQPEVRIEMNEYSEIQDFFSDGNYVHAVCHTELKPIILIMDVLLIKSMTHLCFGGTLVSVQANIPLTIAEEFIMEWFSKKCIGMADSICQISLKRFERSIKTIHSFYQKEKIMLLQLPIVLKDQLIGQIAFLEPTEEEKCS